VSTGLHIVIAIESFFDGGAEVFAIRLANELAISHQVYFVELYPYRSWKKEQLSLLDQKRIKLFQPGKNFIGDWLYNENVQLQADENGTRLRVTKMYEYLKNKQLAFFIKKYKIDIVNSHSWDSDVYFARLKNNVNFKLVSSFHGHYAFLADKRENFNAITQSTLAVMDSVIYTSPEHFETLQAYGVTTEKAVKVFYGFTMPALPQTTRYQKGTCLNLIMVARGIEEKGWEEAILAVNGLLHKYPGLIRLNLVGQGAFLDSLKKKYTNPSIIFTGYTNDVIAMVNAANVGLLPSWYVAESLPNTIIEYLFCGKPVISTNIGAIEEMMMCGSQLAGVCISLSNGKVEVAALAAAIENYIINPESVERDSQIALTASVKFTMHNCVEKYLNAYWTVSGETKKVMIERNNNFRNKRRLHE
jgi:glycosyltransferase involved in cell wall biosynthesis